MPDIISYLLWFFIQSKVLYFVSRLVFFSRILLDIRIEKEFLLVKI